MAEESLPPSASPEAEASPYVAPHAHVSDDSSTPPEEEDGGPVKSFLEHLEDLRWVLIKTVAAIVIGMTTCLVIAPYLVRILEHPLVHSGLKVEINPFGPMGGFVIYMKVALYGGVGLALPFVGYFIGSFVFPALKPTERRYFLWALAIGGGLFLGGVALCYFFVLNICLQGIEQVNTWLGLATNIWRAEEYFSFVLLFMLGMGLSFEIPVIILTLVRLGIIPHEWMIKGRGYFFVANLVLCSFITPDALSTIFMVLPVQILMEICIWISKYWERQKRIAAAKDAT